MPSLLSSHLALLAGAAVYSGWNIIAALTLSDDGIDPLAFSTARELMAFPILYAVAAIFESPLKFPKSTNDRFLFAALGFVLGAFQLCFAFGVALTDAQTAALFQCIEPTTAAFLAAALRTERLTLSALLSALLAGGGVALMQLLDSDDDSDDSNDAVSMSVSRAVGSGLLFMQGMGIALYCIIQGRLLNPPGGDEANGATGRAAKAPGQAYGPITVIAHAYIGSTSVIVCAGGVASTVRADASAPFSIRTIRSLLHPLPLLAVAYAVLLSSCTGYGLRSWANQRLAASTLVLYNAVQPPLTMLLQLALRRRSSIGLAEIGGTALVMAAVALNAKGEACFRCVRRSLARQRGDEHPRAV